MTVTSAPPAPSAVPTPAAWLGSLGAFPFIALALDAWIPIGLSQTASLDLVSAYGAVILSFLGGIQWGSAIAHAQSPSWGRLTASVLPALIGWLALTLPPVETNVVLALAFVAVWFVDRSDNRKGLTPAWYSRLRRPLTIAATSSLLLAALAAVVQTTT